MFISLFNSRLSEDILRVLAEDDNDCEAEFMNTEQEWNEPNYKR